MTSTSYIVVACTSDKRWFDLDSERVPGNSFDRIGEHRGNKKAAETPDGGGYNHLPGSTLITHHPAGAPPLDCWIDGDDWTTRRRLIRLMCPQHVCETCGEPRRRITGNAEYVNSRTGKPVTTLHYRSGEMIDGQGRTINSDGQGDRAATRTAPTLGWTDCGHNQYRRGHVLDPFAGSGTTLIAAAEQGRDATGIDGDPWTLTPTTPEGEPPVSRCLFHVGDVFTELAKIPDDSVDLIVTSPPFLALRSYLPADHPEKHLEIGSEATPAAFLSTLLALTREWRRVLAPHGSIAVELGDTYSGANGWGDDVGNDRYPAGRSGGARRQPTGRGWPLAKSLCLIPSLYAGSLAYGHNLLDPDDTLEPWRVRNLIVWHRPNPPVGALGDKVRPATSYITVACTSTQRWFDLDAERMARPDLTVTNGGSMDPRNQRDDDWRRGHKPESGGVVNPAGAPPLDCWIDGDVWTIPTAPYKGAHYATYPPALPRRLIRLMCPRQVCTVCGEPRRRIVENTRFDSGGNVVTTDFMGGGNRDNGINNKDAVIQWGHNERNTLGWSDCGCSYGDAGFPKFRRGHVLDPFAGSGTTLIAAAEQGRDATGIDLDPRNLDLARQRIGLFLEEAV